MAFSLMTFFPEVAIAQSSETERATNQVLELIRAGNLDKAIELAQKSITLAKREFGAEHRTTATTISNLAFLYQSQGRNSEAIDLFERALKIRMKVLGSEDSDADESFNSIATLLYKQRRYNEAISYYERLLQIRVKALGPDHMDVAQTLNNIATIHKEQGHYGEAESHYMSALAINEKALGLEHPTVSITLNDLGMMYFAQGHYDKVEPLFQRTLAIREKAFGPDHKSVAEALFNLARVYNEQGRFADAERLFQRTLDIQLKNYGPEHPVVANSLNGLAGLFADQGYYGKAEPLYKRALAIREKVDGPESVSVAVSLNNLSFLYTTQGRYAEAEPLLLRALNNWTHALGSEHPDVSTGLSNLAAVYDSQGRYTEAEPLYKRALAIMENFYGPEHPDVALSLNNLAGVYDSQDRYAEAKPLYKRALSIREKVLGPAHLDVAVSLNNLGMLYFEQGDYGEAEPLYKRALIIQEDVLGGKHPDVAVTLDNLAFMYFLQGRHDDALSLMRRVGNIYKDRAVKSTGQLSRGAMSEFMSQKSAFRRFISIGNHVLTDNRLDNGSFKKLFNEMFEIGQLAKATDTAATMAMVGARFAVGEDGLAKAVRERQNLVSRWRQVDKDVISASSLPTHQRDKDGEIRLRRELKSLSQRIADLDQRLAVKFPEYTELSSPKPFPLSEAQHLLNSNEALLTYVVADQQIFLWAARQGEARIYKIIMPRTELAETVKVLRQALDPDKADTIEDMPAFDTVRAHDLYEKIFKVAEPMLKGVNHIFVVPDGPLQSLPLHILVTEKTKSSINNFEDYRYVPWLAKKYALTTLPSVSSLRTLEYFTKATKAPKPFLGIGDPLVGQNSDNREKVTLNELYAAPGVVNADAVRAMFSRVELTGVGLEVMSDILGGERSDVVLRERATEKWIKHTNLSDYRIMAFATHGVVAGDLGATGEAALLMTPPKISTKEDDGILTTSEITALKLNADLVILLACDTAAGDGAPGAEALSGLAKAFFYAGGRSLLVSHWPVSESAGVMLTAQMIEETANDNSIGYAEGLRRSMLKLMQMTKYPHMSHPRFWAPFVVVGEGGIQ